MTQQCYLNGSIMPLSDAKVGITDIGLLRGFGVYEGLITHNRKAFRLKDHLERLHTSAEKMSLKVPVSDEAIADAMDELVRSNVPADKEALIRLILTGGPATGVIEYNPKTPTLFILADVFSPIEEKYLTEGCSVAPVEYHRDLAEIKSINYIKTVLLQKERKEKGALEVVFTWQGKVLECGGSNIFLVKDGTLITPKEGIVYGITRKVVLELAKPHFAIEEREVTESEMYDADQVFITGSFKEIVPVVKVGDKIIGTGVVGPVTKQLIDVFREYAHSY